MENLIHYLWCIVSAIRNQKQKFVLPSYILVSSYTNWHTSFGSANIPTIAVSIASWFSTRDALAAIKTTVSASTPLAKTCESTSRKRVGIVTIQYRIQIFNLKQASLQTTSVWLLPTVSLINVRVPVLSRQSTSMPAISSIAVILIVMVT